MNILLAMAAVLVLLGFLASRLYGRPRTITHEGAKAAAGAQAAASVRAASEASRSSNKNLGYW